MRAALRARNSSDVRYLRQPAVLRALALAGLPHIQSLAGTNNLIPGPAYRFAANYSSHWHQIIQIYLYWNIDSIKRQTSTKVGRRVLT